MDINRMMNKIPEKADIKYYRFPVEVEQIKTSVPSTPVSRRSCRTTPRAKNLESPQSARLAKLLGATMTRLEAQGIELNHVESFRRSVPSTP